MTINDNNRALFSIETGDTVEFKDGTLATVAECHSMEYGTMFQVIRHDNGNTAYKLMREIKLVNKFASVGLPSAANGQQHFHY